MRALLTAIAILALGVAFYFYFGPGRGVYEIEQCHAAVRKARSWHMQGQTRSREDRPWNTFARDVSCPGAMHETARVTDEEGHEHLQELVILNEAYYSRRTDGTWLFNPTGAPPEPVPDCAFGPLLPSHANLFGDQKEVLANARITAGQMESAGGASCRNWEVSFPSGSGYTPRYWICINQGDHLPRRVTFPNNSASFEFSMWNATSVSAPAISTGNP